MGFSPKANIKFTYEAHTACDKHGYILSCIVTPVSVQDRVAFDPLYEIVADKFSEIKEIVADAKKHEMMYTTLTGLAQISKWVKLKFACMNLKKFAIHLWKGNNSAPYIYIINTMLPLLSEVLSKTTPVPELGTGVV